MEKMDNIQGKNNGEDDNIISGDNARIARRGWRCSRATGLDCAPVFCFRAIVTSLFPGTRPVPGEWVVSMCDW